MLSQRPRPTATLPKLGNSIARPFFPSASNTFTSELAFRVYTATNFPADARSVIRVSIGVDSTPEEVDGFGIALRDCVDRLRAGALL